MTTTPETLCFTDGKLVLIDQTRLPVELVTLTCTTVDQVHDAIRRLVVRGAPAIGIAAAYGVCLAVSRDSSPGGTAVDRDAYRRAIDFLATSRPTAVNLFWALDRMKAVIERTAADEELPAALIAEATAIHDEDRQMCKRIGQHGATLLADCQRVLTHCNAGGLATSMWGTALAPIYHLHQAGHPIEVYADETRPLMQGARLTAWELSQAGVPVTVLTDSMAGSLLRSGRIDAVIVGAIGLPPTATWRTRLELIHWPCWRTTTPSRFTSPRRRAHSILRSRAETRSRSKNVIATKLPVLKAFALCLTRPR